MSREGRVCPTKQGHLQLGFQALQRFKFDFLVFAIYFDFVKQFLLFFKYLFNVSVVILTLFTKTVILDFMFSDC